MDVTVSQNQYSFPILKHAEIIQCLGEAGIEVAEAELKEPNRHKDKVKSTFLALVELGLGITAEDFSNKDPTTKYLINKMDYPELYQDAFSSLKFFRSCQKLFKICGMPGFTFNDLGAPTPKRYKRQLSAAINYIKFREERLALYAELHEQRETLLNGLLEVQQEKQLLTQQLNQVKTDADGRWKEAQMIDADCEDIEKEIAQQNKLQKDLRKQSTQLKKEASLLKDNISGTDLALQELDSEERRLRPNIVDSPEELYNVIQELETDLEEEKKHRSVAMEENKLAEMRLRNIEMVKKDILDATKLVSEIVVEESKFDALAKECSDIKQAIYLKEQERKALESQKSEHEKDLDNIENATKENKNKSKQKMEAALSALQTANAELVVVEKNQRDAKTTLDQQEQEVVFIKTLMEEEKNKTDREIEDISRSFYEMEKVVMDRQQKFDDVIMGLGKKNILVGGA